MVQHQQKQKSKKQSAKTLRADLESTESSVKSNEVNSETQSEEISMQADTSAPSDITTENQTESVVASEAQSSEASTEETSSTETQAEPEPVRIEFPYSEILRSQAPKAFEVAEKVATDWKNQGDFTDLGITHPVAGMVAAQALTKAKEVEKKLEEKGVISIAKLGFQLAKSQVETIKSKIVKS